MRHHQCPAGGAASTSSGPGRVGCGNAQARSVERDAAVLERAAAPYLRSPRSGVPREAQATRSWWDLPVRGSSCRSARPPRTSRRRQRVRASFEPSRSGGTTATRLAARSFSRCCCSSAPLAGIPLDDPEVGLRSPPLDEGGRQPGRPLAGASEGEDPRHGSVEPMHDAEEDLARLGVLMPDPLPAPVEGARILGRVRDRGHAGRLRERQHVVVAPPGRADGSRTLRSVQALHRSLRGAGVLDARPAPAPAGRAPQPRPGPR